MINACVPGGNYPATKMNPVLTFANQNFNITAGDPTATDDYSAGYVNLKSFWYNTLTQTVFICVDDTNGSAVWVDITPDPINQNAAFVINITRGALLSEIGLGTVNPKAIYRITDAVSGTSVMRVYGITTLITDTNAFKEGSFNGVVFVPGDVGTYDLGTDVFTSVTNPNAATVIDIISSDLQTAINLGTINSKAQYRVIDALSGNAVIRVYGTSSTSVDTNGFKEGSYDGANFVAGEIGLYDAGNDTFISIVNPNNAEVIDITVVDLQLAISLGEVNPKAQYRIIDAIGSTEIVRVYGTSSVTIDTNAFKEGSYDGLVFTAGEVGVYDLGTDVFTSVVNPNNAIVIDIISNDLANEITSSTINPKAQYRITDAIGSTAVVRVYGTSASTIDTNGFKEGSWDGANFVAGEIGLYDLSTDTFTAIGATPDLDAVLTAGNTANGYTVEISGTPDNNVSISSAAYTGTGNVGLGNNALNGNTANDSVGIGYAALQGNTGLRAVSLGYLAGSGNKGGDTVSLGTSAARDNEGFFVVGVGYDAAKENIGDYVVALGSGAAFNNTQSNRFVISNNSLPSFADHAAAAAAITTGSGASAGNTYLYHNQATDSIGAVRL